MSYESMPGVTSDGNFAVWAASPEGNIELAILKPDML
jgi:hypothetical protein